MRPEELLEILQQAGKLKTTYRHCYTEGDRRESTADHSWRIALMAMLLEDVEEFHDIDFPRVIRMCLIHDLGETITGDIPVFMKTDNNEKTEAQLLDDWVRSFPAETAGKWLALYEEMEKLETREAKLYKALDKLEAVISHNESDISTWLPLEYDLQLTHGRDNVRFSPYLQQLKQAVDDWTLRKIAAGKTTDEQTDQPAAGSCPETRDDR